jgi:hypothetical protein
MHNTFLPSSDIGTPAKCHITWISLTWVIPSFRAHHLHKSNNKNLSNIWPKLGTTQSLLICSHQIIFGCTVPRDFGTEGGVALLWLLYITNI